jgi:hypothetical protein
MYGVRSMNNLIKPSTSLQTLVSYCTTSDRGREYLSVPILYGCDLDPGISVRMRPSSGKDLRRLAITFAGLRSVPSLGSQPAYTIRKPLPNQSINTDFNIQAHKRHYSPALPMTCRLGVHSLILS